MYCNKSIMVQSNLLNSPQLKYKPMPGEFRDLRWNIAVASVAFESNNTLSFPCFVTCNFVTEKQINDSSVLVDYEQPLCSFFFDTKQNSSKKLVRFGMKLFINIFDFTDYLNKHRRQDFSWSCLTLVSLSRLF